MATEKISGESCAKKILQVAEKSQTEEEVKIAVQGILQEALKGLGIDIEAKYERAIFNSKRADAVYPTVVIEYKKPNSLTKDAVKARAKEELKNYLKGLAGKAKISRKFIGVALDGYNIMFLRIRLTEPKESKKVQLTLQGQVLKVFEEWDVIGPKPVSAETIEQLLLYFRALTSKTLNAENLAEDFGSKSPISRQTIKLLYRLLSKSENSKVKTLFEEWNRLFGVIYGKELGVAEKDAQKFSAELELEENVDFKKLLFSIHTYFALIMKMIAAETIAMQRGFLLSSFMQKWKVATSNELLDEMKDLEDGGPFKRAGIQNFMEGDFFNWYIQIWNDEVATSIREMARKLSDYEPATPKLEPEETRDLLKKLYHYLIPKEIRHDLGEYYTPDWLAELLLNEMRYNGDPRKRILDPACGSGTFIVLALRRVAQYVKENPEQVPNNIVLKTILKNVVGFDINPLAVLASRTNYLISLTEFRRSEQIEIPIYLCDSVLTPAEYATVFDRDYRIPSSVGDFGVPKEAVELGHLDDVLEIIEETVSFNGDLDDFLEKINDRLPNLPRTTVDTIKLLFNRITLLNKAGKNKIWTRIIKNNFAPISHGKFDYVAGNPPWIRWTYLSDEYRNATWKMWEGYGLFTQKGIKAKMGTAELDFSMLFLYACSDFFLEKGGKLGFLITQEVFKSKGAGEGFRHFEVKGVPLGIISVHDLVSVKPFESASNKTTFLVLEKGSVTRFPVSYTIWKKKRVGKIMSDSALSTVLVSTSRKKALAKPLNKITDPWQIFEKGAEETIERIRGQSFYKGRIGARVEPYGIYWLKVKSVRPDNLVIVENLPELGRTGRIKKVEAVLENEMVFPIVRGADIDRWKATPSIYALILNKSTRKEDIPEEKWMKANFPKTYQYLFNFKDRLLDRENYWKFFSKDIKSKRELKLNSFENEWKYSRPDGKDREGQFIYSCTNVPFYAMFNVGDYTFSPYKLAWSRMSNDLKAAVISDFVTPYGKRLVIPTDTTSIISFKEKRESHFVCSILNSSPAREFIKSFSSAGRGFGAPGILNYIKIPRYDRQNKLHSNLADFSLGAHQAAKTNDENTVKEIEEKIDSSVEKLWKIKP
jgi:type I restriction-modification system DNA methylase subunit